MACTVSREIFVEENANKHLYVAFTPKAEKIAIYRLGYSLRNLEFNTIICYIYIYIYIKV